MHRKYARYGTVAAMALLMAGCAAVPTPTALPPAPRPTPAPTPAPAPPTTGKSWEDRAVNPGAWRYDAGSRTATFAPAGSSSALLTMSCAGGGIRLTSALDGNVALRTSAGTDQIRFDGGSATVPGRDIRLDRIAFSRGRFALESANGVLTLPVQSEIGRVIEDCR